MYVYRYKLCVYICMYIYGVYIDMYLYIYVYIMHSKNLREGSQLNMNGLRN
jgi:hypothetical protein